MEEPKWITIFNDKCGPKSHERHNNVEVLKSFGFYETKGNSTAGKLQFKEQSNTIMVKFGAKGASGNFNLYENRPITITKHYYSISEFESEYLKILKELKVKGELSNTTLPKTNSI
jgi:hypothetical protein